MLRTRSFPALAAGAALSAIALPQVAAAHGYMDYPPARQEVCDSDGGYWGATDGSGIPNAACRSAYLESSWYPFVQKPEFAKLVSDFTNQAAVEAAIPDGTLCAAADAKKAGIDIPSADWQATPIDPSLNGKLTLLYRASTPHNPSFWKIYLSKPGYNPATDALAWSDLDLVAEFDNLPVVLINEKKYYQMSITLPTDRTGNAVLYSRWQRVDPAGEGFYNCSDISFGGEVIPSPWTSLGGALKPTTDANAGDTVWFRVFDGNGNETVFEKLPIDANNQNESVWAKQLAQTINASASGVGLGKLDASGLVTWDSADLYGNLVYVKNTDASFQLEVKAGAVNTAPTLAAPVSASVNSGETVTVELTAFDADKDVLTFTASAGELTVNGNSATLSYSAPVTTADLREQITVSVTDGKATASSTITVTVKGSGTQPGNSDWDPKRAYLAGDKVTHLGTAYTAQWWTQGEEPGTVSAWKAEKSAGDTAWDSKLSYTSGDVVTYKGQTYKAKWWTKGDVPTNGGPWQAVK